MKLKALHERCLSVASARYFLYNGKEPIYSEALIGSEHGTDILYGENGSRIKDLIMNFIDEKEAFRVTR